ncbi:MAG: DUF192 domain-containing protein [Acidimicrobiia bacterium]
MGWLVKDGHVLASLEVASEPKARRRGLLGRNGIEGALLIERGRWVHTVGMRFPIDVAFIDGQGRVIHCTTMARHRVGIPQIKARAVIEAEAGAFARWGLALGDYLELRS